MHETILSIVLAVLAVLAAIASVLAFRRVFKPDRASVSQRTLIGLVLVITFGAAIGFVYRWIHVGQWQPLKAHLDGLLLLSTLLGATILFILSRRRLFGLSAFGLPILTLFLAWGICAAQWSYRPFQMQSLHPVWFSLHLAGVYLGTLGAMVAAGAGAMYLFVESRLKRKTDLSAMGRMASLEALENVIVRSATLGFILLTLGLISGVVVIVEKQAAPVEGFYWKLGFAVVAWIVYALLMNVRYTASFRGRRAAWLSIVGLLLLVVVYAVVISIQIPGGAG